MKLGLIDGQIYSIAPIEYKDEDFRLELRENRAVVTVLGHEIAAGVRFFVVKGREFISVNHTTGEIQIEMPGVFTLRAIIGNRALDLTHAIVQLQPTQSGPKDPVPA